MLVPGLARDTLVWATDHTDPITCLGAAAGGLLAMGTAAGSVRMFFLQHSEWKSVLLCTKSEEAVVGLYFRDDESELFAVVGDVCVKVWDLNNLHEDQSSCGGCRVRKRIEFALIHSLDYCSSTCTLVDGDLVLVMRNNGEGCVLNLSSNAAPSLFQDFGPLPAMNSLTLPVGMRGNHVVFASSAPGSQSLSVWPITNHQQLQAQQRAIVLPSPATVGGRCVLAFEDELLFLLHGELCLLRWRGGDNEGETPREIAQSHGSIVSFDFQPPNRVGWE
ncbi:hypothetical protein BASA81_001451 [Batrachochytrium salamandrivorans]|nr:hypothetical protein BASA81_001451 [Batrachochytrium salamandrivorans]